MATYTQANRMMNVKTPAGPDVFLLAGISGQDGLSQLYHFQLDLLVEHTKKGANPIPTEVAIDDLLGESITVELTLPNQATRYYNGICNRIIHGGADEDFTSYQMEIVPKFWLLTRSARSRIFQPPESSVPDILKKVLENLDVEWDIQGTFHPRDYCVQYRESDFNFACRVMEEEGIYYYFTHDDGSHKMVVANTPNGHHDMPNGSEVLFSTAAGAETGDDRVSTWSKVQQLRSGKYMLWDYCFEKPESNLEAVAEIQDSVEVGEKTHKLKVGGNGSYEIYDYPGEYSQRFDGIDKGGAEQPEEIEKIFEDNARTVGIRMQEEAACGVLIQGTGSCRQFVSGHKFTLQQHPHANGEYVMTTVSHNAVEGSYRSSTGSFLYSNSFSCIPAALPFRPPRISPKPVVAGTQTAVVVGPEGEEIYTDKYGRVKVQFPWDREGTNDAGSSCWIRVGTPWAGPQWGMIHIPRMGHEAIVDFLEGDPDQPIIVGNVYNAANMPPYDLPDNKTQSGVKSRSSLEGTPENYNEIRFEDAKDDELITVHAEKNFSRTVENDETVTVCNNRTITVGVGDKAEGKHTETIKGDTKIVITDGNYGFDVQTGTAGYHVKGAVTEDFDDTLKTGVANKIEIESETADIYVKASTKIKLEVGSSSLTMESGGKITLKGTEIVIAGSTSVDVKPAKIALSGSEVTVDGDSIASHATGKHTIQGSPSVDINC